MRPPLALLLALSLPAAAAEYTPPDPNAPACRRALDLLERLAGEQPVDLAPGLGYHVDEVGPEKGVYLARERAGTAAFVRANPDENVNVELRREDGTPVYVSFRFEGGRRRAVVAGASPIPGSRLVSDFSEDGMRRMTRARVAASIAMHRRAAGLARERDSRERLPLDQSAQLLTCPRDVWAGVINLCRSPEQGNLFEVLAVEYCKENVCLGRLKGPLRVWYHDFSRCARDERGKGDRLDRHKPR